MKNYIIAYDVLCPKRAYKIRKILYSYALGGQKSVLEILLSSRELKALLGELKLLLGDEDSINIIEVRDEIIAFTKSEILIYDKGVIIV